MTVLPIKTITDFDQPVYGANLVNLAKLARLDLPVAAGIAIVPPELVLKTVIKYIDSGDNERFEQSLNLIKSEVLKIPLPEALEKELVRCKEVYCNGRIVRNKKQLWGYLLENWLDQIKVRIWQKGFIQGVALNLKPQIVYQVSQAPLEISAYYDPDLKEVVVKTDYKIHPRILKKIDHLVDMANKKLFIPQVYSFLIIKDKVLISGLKPFTQTLPASKEPVIVLPRKEQAKLIKSAVKVFYNLSSAFPPLSKIDGILIEGEKLSDFQKAVFKLSESSLAIPGKPVIFKLADTFNQEIRGVLRLINDRKLLDDQAKILLEVRNKQERLNVQLGIPLVRSSHEYLQLKRELAAKNITRKGSLNFWVEMSVPENIINLDDYLQAGLDGVIIDLDRLQKGICNYGLPEKDFQNFQCAENFAYGKQVKSLIKFISPALATLHKAGIPVIVKGELNLHHEVLDPLVELGVWGVVANTPAHAEMLPEYLVWSEKRLIKKRVHSHQSSVLR